MASGRVRFEMLGFGPITKEIGVEPDAPAAQFEMKLLSAAEIKAAVAAAMAPPAPAAPARGSPTPRRATGRHGGHGGEQGPGSRPRLRLRQPASCSRSRGDRNSAIGHRAGQRPRRARTTERRASLADAGG